MILFFQHNIFIDSLGISYHTLIILISQCFRVYPCTCDPPPKKEISTICAIYSLGVVKSPICVIHILTGVWSTTSSLTLKWSWILPVHIPGGHQLGIFITLSKSSLWWLPGYAVASFVMGEKGRGYYKRIICSYVCIYIGIYNNNKRNRSYQLKSGGILEGFMRVAMKSKR